MNKIWQADWLMLRNISPFVCFAHFQVYLQLGGSNTTSVLARKNTNTDFIFLQLPNQIISKSVGVVFLDLWSAQSTSPNARCVPSEHVLISQNRSTFSFLFAFRTHFYRKRIWDEAVSLSPCWIVMEHGWNYSHFLSIISQKCGSIFSKEIHIMIAFYIVIKIQLSWNCYLKAKRNEQHWKSHYNYEAKITLRFLAISRF